MRNDAAFLIFSLLALPLSAREVTVTVLATTDMHGHIYPYDYLAGRPAERGLAKIATLIKAERKSAPSALLVDCGDTIQGSQLESVYQTGLSAGKLPAGMNIDPMMAAMNALGYDAMAVGNHEYNYGWKNFEKARNEAKFPWLSANTKALSGSAHKAPDPYLIKMVDGVKVGIVGITTPAVPNWEKPENYAGYTFTAARPSVEEAVRELRSKQKVDVVLVIAHSGLERENEPARPVGGLGENITGELAAISGVDAIIFGHTHDQVEQLRIGDVLLTQPKNWAMSLSRMDLKLESKPEGGYRVVSKTARVLPVTNAIEADPAILRLAAPYHEITEHYLNTVVAKATNDLSATTSRVEDTAMIDAIQRVQMHYSKADVSFASSFNPRAAISKGDVTIRQVAALYLYDNELYAIEGTGQMVKDALENAAKYFIGCQNATCSNKPLINSAVIGYNFDMAQGVTYEIDLTSPVGNRIRNLRFEGKPLAMDRKLRIALNNYRSAGSNGYVMFKGAKVVWRSYDDIRDLIVRYYADHDLPSGPDNNWRIVPEIARQALRIEASRPAPPTLK